MCLASPPRYPCFAQNYINRCLVSDGRAPACQAASGFGNAGFFIGESQVEFFEITLAFTSLDTGCGAAVFFPVFSQVELEGRLFDIGDDSCR